VTYGTAQNARYDAPPIPAALDRCAFAGTNALGYRARVERSGSALWNEAVARYRLHAAHCVELAEKTPDAEGRLTLLAMAQSWLALAERAVKNSETALGYETALPKQVP
jgi:hypothetical protein